MPVQKNTSIAPGGVPDVPQLLERFLQLEGGNSADQLNYLEQSYPAFFQHLLQIINSDHFNLSIKVESLQQAVDVSGSKPVLYQLLIQVIYRVFNQYRINGLELKQFWEDSMRRAVAARLLGEMTGLDAAMCFTAGFMQDLGLFLLFYEQPEKGSLWSELRKREPEARLQMEMNTFGHSHEVKLRELVEAWKLSDLVTSAVYFHHDCDKVDAELDKQFCKVMQCCDYLSAVFSAEDKSYIINRVRDILVNEFSMEAYRAEELLAALPDELDISARILGVDVGEPVLYSQILYQANIHLNEANLNFQELTHRLERAIDERDRLAAEVNRDLNLAREIQQSLLPMDYLSGYPVNGINISAKILSGDFYDYFELHNGEILFNLGDVSGKGVNAALLMAKASSLFRCLGKRIPEPGELLYEVNNELCETSIHGMFVTMVAGRYNPESGEVVLVNAGNPPALLMKTNGLCIEYEASSPPLGVLPDTIYTEYTFELGNDSLYMYSDGVIEGYMNDNTVLDIGGLFRMIARMDRQSSPLERLQTIVDKFTHTQQALRDDVTLLLLETQAGECDE